MTPERGDVASTFALGVLFVAVALLAWFTR